MATSRHFAVLYQRYRAPLMRFCAASSRDTRSEAEEIFQETWIAVIDSRARYSVRARFVTLLFAIAHRRAADGWRKRARHPVAPRGPRSLTTPKRAPATNTIRPLRRSPTSALARAARPRSPRLPVEQRAVFLLRAETGLGVREIAAITRCTARSHQEPAALRTARTCARRWSPWA